MKRTSMLALSILIAGAVMAQPRGPAGPPPPDARMETRAMAAYLSLTEEQVSVWHSIHAERRATFEALHEQERALRDQLDEANEAAEIGRLVLELREVKTKIDVARDAAAAKFAEILTAEQQVKFAAFQQATEFLQHRRPPRSR